MTSPQGTSGDAFAKLAAFLQGGRLTGVVSDLEHVLDGTDAQAAAAAATEAGLDSDLLEAALLVRRDVGRLNDLIHAAAVSLALPELLEPGERIAKRPSLAAGNDPGRPFDLETDRRVAEFKLGVWSATGSDAMRKRGVFKDLVHLAAAGSDRRAELYVVGPKPLRFLRQSRSTAGWALNRGADSTRELFTARFGPLAMPVREFTAGPGSHVHLVDLTDFLPVVGTSLSG